LVEKRQNIFYKWVIDTLIDETEFKGFSDENVDFTYICPFSVEADDKYVSTHMRNVGDCMKFKKFRITDFTEYFKRRGMGIQSDEFDYLYELYSARMDEIFLKAKLDYYGGITKPYFGM
jgi:hypothetical protein